jgi:hypothetical protein
MTIRSASSPPGCESVPYHDRAEHGPGVGRRRRLEHLGGGHPDHAGGTIDNLGWPCYEGNGQQSGYRDANLAICNNFTAYEVTRLVQRWEHGWPDGREPLVGMSSAAARVAFSDPAGNYPADYDNSVLFTDCTPRMLGVIPIVSSSPAATRHQ